MKRTGNLQAVGFVLVLALGFLPVIGNADVRVSVRAEPDQLSQDESTSIVVKAEADGQMGELDIDFSAPDFDLINQYEGSTGFQTVYDNGRFSAKTTKSLIKVLRPRKSGTLIVDQIKVKVGGKIIDQPALRISVFGGGAGGQATGQGLQEGRRSHGGQARSGKRYFLQTDVDKDKAYLGEQVIASYYLYFKPNSRISDPAITKFPEFDGWLREEMDIPARRGNMPIEQVSLNGEPWSRVLLARYALYPLKAGELAVDPMTVKIKVLVTGQSQSDEDDPFGGIFQIPQFKDVVEIGNSIVFHAVDLPSQGKPSDFSGAVGQFSIEGMVDKNQVKAGDAITLTAKVEGRGNVTTIQKLGLGLPGDIEIFDTKGRILPPVAGLSTKVFEYVLVPKNEGQFNIGPLTLSFFNPKSGSYESKTVETIPITVTGKSLNAISSNPNSQKLEDAGGKNGGLDLGVVPYQAGLNSKGRKDFSLLIAILSIGIGVFSLFLLGGKLGIQWLSAAMKKRAEQSKTGESGIKLIKRTIANLKVSKGQKSNLKPSELYEALAKGIYGLLEIKFPGIEARSLSRSQLKQLLMDQYKTTEEEAQKWIGILEKVEFGIFSGAMDTNEVIQVVLGFLDDSGVPS